MPAVLPIPLVSVIIPCYNYSHFLAEAIDSVLRQTHLATEIVVVDDGSVDDTRAVAARYPRVRYIYQHNQGLAAARNTGIENSTGTYITFLDADDWLFPDALAVNVQYLEQSQPAAFSAGWHTAVEANGFRREVMNSASPNAYLGLLARGNYIAMIAAVMFRRAILADFRFDTSLANCEDYDLFLRIARHHPVVQHQTPLAAYRFHDSAMSAHIPSMLVGALAVLGRHRPLLHTPDELAAYHQGVSYWTWYYCQRLWQESKVTPSAFAATMAFFLKRAPAAAYYYSLTGTKVMMKKAIKRLLPRTALKGLNQLGLIGYPIPQPGHVTTGDFSQTTPFSTIFGYDRGGPIDRYYIENFLQQESASIHGRVLEIGDNAYTKQFGASRVIQSDVLHIDPINAQATFVGDLSNAPHLPDAAFDCIILTQTLHLIYDFKGALMTCYRILKPGGTLLLTVPGITPIDKGEWKETWYWSFTDKALSRLMTELYTEAMFEIQSFGNVGVAAAYLYGMGLPEISRDKLDYYDPQFQVINTLKAVKQPVNA